MAGEEGRPTSAEVSEREGELRVLLHHDASTTPDPSVAQVMAEVYARAGAAGAGPMTVEVRRAASCKALLALETVPGYGWRSVMPLGESVARGSEAVVSEGPDHLANGLVEILVDPLDGTFTLGDLPGMDRLVDEDDLGDTYNFSPAPAPARSRPSAVEVELLEAGPVRGRLLVRRSYQGDATGPVPSPDASVTVSSVIEVRAGDPLVRITAVIDNRRSDHRLRTVFPLPSAVAQTVAECAFSTVARGEAEGGAHEPALATYPSRRFVRAGSLTIFHDGLLEHELIGSGSALAVTLLRCTGVLSRPATTARPNRAGPDTAVPAAQMQGVQTVRYGVVVGDVDPYDTADGAWSPLLLALAPGGGPLPPLGSRPSVSGARVSALHRRAGALELRLYNPAHNEAVVDLPGHSGSLVDLADQPLSEWDRTFAIRPWGISTARLHRHDLD